ncbi:MAG: iron donor protein CyaY [Planctomycetes bacterium]|nr:iron donor protein CyaY [Planctomycetota bacterium]MCB9904776.1 iron donor protein CyaY [Planctomycetota bacterium]
MDQKQFLMLADACLRRVEDRLEDFDPDELDYEPADGVVKLIFADGTVFVLNRQTAADQMWFAAGARAWHYDWDADSESWRDDKEGGELFARISETISKKLAREVRV